MKSLIPFEIGHACGLCDIFDAGVGTALSVSGMPSESRMPDDWGWYPPEVTHADIIKRHLMYGGRSDTKADMSYGDIYALYYTKTLNANGTGFNREWHLENAPVGFGLHCNRNPMSQ